MKRTFLIAGSLLAVAAGAAEAQLANFPVLALPTAGDAPTTFFSAEMGRGLNDASGKINAFGAAVGRTGLGGRITAAVGAGMVNDDPDAKYTFGVAGSVDMLPPGGTTQVSVQTGIGYMSQATDVSMMNFPIGVALRANMAAGSGGFSPWVMPRINLARASVLGTSETQTDFGVSGGAGFSTAGGFGVHAAIDLLATDPSVTTFGIGVHVMMR